MRCIPFSDIVGTSGSEKTSRNKTTADPNPQSLDSIAVPRLYLNSLLVFFRNQLKLIMKMKN